MKKVKKKNNLIKGIIIGVVLILGIVLSVLLLNKNYSEEKMDGKTVLSDEEAVNIGNDLYKQMYNVLYKSDKWEYDNEPIECNYGVGCLFITNWDEVTKIFTKDYLDTLKDEEEALKYGLQIIDDKPYLVDGYNDYENPDFNVINLEIKEEEIISFIIDSSFKDNSKKEYELVLKKDGDVWKIDSYKEK